MSKSNTQAESHLEVFEVVDARELARRWSLPVTWIREQCRSRATEYAKCFVMMGMCDESQTRAGYPAFDYGDKEVELLCRLWLEGYRRAKAGDSLFRGLFERELTLHDRTVLGLD
jgi:hypothetical protein